MAQDPVATAASNNPALSTLVAAVKKAGLVDTLNNAQNITVFAPTNDAFAKIPKATLDKVLNDKAQLTKILTYHVVGQKLTPKDLENGSFDTLEKSKVMTSGSGESYTVDDSANVVCGNVKTANANVYIIDSVLMPMRLTVRRPRGTRGRHFGGALGPFADHRVTEPARAGPRQWRATEPTPLKGSTT